MFSILRNSLVAVVALLFFLPMGSYATKPEKTIEIHAKRFNFLPAEITLKKGETVKLVLYSDDVPHSLLIKDLNVNSNIVKGSPSEITITPEKAGDFTGICGRFCGSGHGSMKLTVHVTEG